MDSQKSVINVITPREFISKMHGSKPGHIIETISFSESDKIFLEYAYTNLRLDMCFLWKYVDKHDIYLVYFDDFTARTYMVVDGGLTEVASLDFIDEVNSMPEVGKVCRMRLFNNSGPVVATITKGSK